MIYSIPITWESYKRYNVEAENLQEAVEKALDIFFKEPDENYLEDSFKIDETCNEDYENETFDEDVVINNVINKNYK